MLHLAGPYALCSLDTLPEQLPDEPGVAVDGALPALGFTRSVCVS